MERSESYDLVVIGSGPAGHVGALCAARAGKRVLVVERDRGVGGACVQRGTIPSKTLRETAAYFAGLRARSCGAFDVQVPPHLQLVGLMGRVEEVVQTHSLAVSHEMANEGIDQWHGRARFAGPHDIEVEGVRGDVRRASASQVLIAVGSRPRTPPNVPVDHEHILDSDSVLSTMYVPETLTILGAGVIASEYASIFASLGVRVTMIDRNARPMGFLDPDLSDGFVEYFEQHDGCRFLGERGLLNVSWDGVSSVVTELDDGEVIRADKMLCTLGRVANIDGLQIDQAGLEPTARGLLAVDENCCTAVGHIYAAGDVIGPPSLASSSKEQGRRAMCHAYGLPAPSPPEMIPIGIYTIPEISSVGLTEAGARERHGDVLVGRANFCDVARGVIGCNTIGFVKLLADPANGKILGAHILGDGATELIHIAQTAMLADQGVELFSENIFNFPTLTELYQIAAQDISRRLGGVPV